MYTPLANPKIPKSIGFKAWCTYQSGNNYPFYITEYDEVVIPISSKTTDSDVTLSVGYWGTREYIVDRNVIGEINNYVNKWERGTDIIIFTITISNQYTDPLCHQFNRLL